jgi:quinol monooxygenase YgiN
MSFFSTDKTSAEDGHINVIAEISAKPEHAHEVKALLEALVEPSRAEDGCKGYHLLVNKADSASFYTYEEWTSEDKLQQHLAGAKPMLDKAKHLLAADMKLTILEHLV